MDCCLFLRLDPVIPDQLLFTSIFLSSTLDIEKKDMAMEEFEVFIKGKLINLVVITRSLAQNSAWYTWFNDEETTGGMQQHYFPNTRELQVAFFESEINNYPNKLQ